MKLNSLFIKLICISYISAFFMACEDPNEVGSSLQKETSLTTFIDTFTIESEVVYFPEELLTNKAQNLLVGTYIDPNFGTTTAKSFFQLRLSEENISIDDNAVCDSVVFFLPYQIDEFEYSKNGTSVTKYKHANIVGDTTKTQTISLHELTENVNDRDYYVSDALTYDPTILGSVTLAHTPLQTDTLRIPLNKEFGSRLLTLARNGTQDALLNDLKGMALVGDNSDAAILAFDHINNSPAVVYVYYSTSENTGFYFRFYVNAESQNFNSITIDRSTTKLNTLQKSGDKISTNNLENLAYIQAGTGLQTQIKIPNFQKFTEENPNISINKAELVLHVEETIPQYAYSNGPPLSIFLNNVSNDVVDKGDDDNIIQIENDLSIIIGSTSYGFGYNPENNSYTLPITSYIQDLALGTRNLEALNISSALNATRVNMSRFYAHNHTNQEKAMKLKVYYTKVQ